MNTPGNTILFVDDETSILNAFKRLLRKENYHILTASSGTEAMRIVKENDVHLVVSDQRMPEMTGAELLKKVKEYSPDIIRIILTGYTEVSTITDSINEGNIYKFLLKPWNDDHLKQEIKKALEQYELVKDNKNLQEKVFAQNEKLKKINDNLEQMVKKRTRELELRNYALEVSHNVLANLPFAIIGVDAEGTISLVNKSTGTIKVKGKPALVIGENISSYFPDDCISLINEVIEKNIVHKVNKTRFENIPFNIIIAPLCGSNSFRGKGAVMTFY